MKKSKCGEHMGKQKSQPTAMQLIGFVKSDPDGSYFELFGGGFEADK
jgi:hypothetical protein